jgi:hypothetical protein
MYFLDKCNFSLQSNKKGISSPPIKNRTVKKKKECSIKMIIKHLLQMSLMMARQVTKPSSKKHIIHFYKENN